MKALIASLSQTTRGKLFVRALLRALSVMVA
jgi:hypothetical protein